MKRQRSSENVVDVSVLGRIGYDLYADDHNVPLKEVILYALVKAMPLTEALKYGNAAAAIVVSRLICSEAMPTLAEVEALIARYSEIQVQS
ncbi:hypothetical protein MYX65_10330 [Acidobacteria bacterium AH-259-L09]|nr:hypothetical protein [Acidobacteria bacterium AH-259-L09]